ncbi:hypothetical protein KSP39_PZI012950 [Platanthera zijinensis]|uniref:Uncharacterized protein n=1 Tax=Platanthera zijinensis TaxID=2320716 RepID=A0AAP0BCH0_9ASPA
MELDEFYLTLQWISSEICKQSFRAGKREIGEKFVEFLEKELNMNDDLGTKAEKEAFSSAKKKDQRTDEFQRESSMEDSIDDIEATLAQLKKNLGL